MTVEELAQIAAQATKNAYAPYSGVTVGAALISEDQVFTGANVENGSYGLTICAERAALFAAINQGHRKFTQLAVASNQPRPLQPCGACLQVLSEFCDDLYPAKTAHFGCTLLRVEAIKRLPKPWFSHIPNKDNRWGEGRVDEDINFWHKWKDAGNTLFMANHVPIGHLQQVATWPDEAFLPFHQYVTDFQKNGPPAEARR